MKPGQRDAGVKDTVVDLANRLSQRRTRRRPVVIGLALFVVSGIAIWVVWFSQLFAVRSVSVAGIHFLTATEVTQVARAPMGQQLSRVDIGAVQHRIAALPAVRHVVVKRSWPNTLRIQITERQPVVVSERNKELWLTDGSGVLFHKVSKAPAKMPHLQVANPSPTDATTRACLTALAALPQRIRDSVTALHATNEESVTMQLTNERTVRWGSAAQTEEKAQVLSALLERPGTFYDVSAPSVVVMR